MQTFLVNRKFIQCLKKIMTLCKDPDTKIILKGNKNIIELLFSTTKDRNCTIEYRTSLEAINTISNNYVEKFGLTYIYDEIKSFLTIKDFIFSNNFLKFKELINIVDEKDQLWILKTNHNGSREISIVSEGFFYNSILNYDISFNDCIINEDTKWIEVEDQEKFNDILQIHYLISNTSYNKTIGSNSSIIAEKNENFISITSTNGRIMINSQIKINGVNEESQMFKILLPKSIKKISEIFENNESKENSQENSKEKINNKLYINISEKKITFSNKNCKIYIVKNPPKDISVIKTLCEFDDFKKSIIIYNYDMKEIAKFSKIVKTNVSDINEIEIINKIDDNKLIIRFKKRGILVEKHIGNINENSKGLNLKTGQDIFAFIGSMLDTLIKKEEEGFDVVIDHDDEVPYARIKLKNFQTNIFFVLLNNQ